MTGLRLLLTFSACFISGLANATAPTFKCDFQTYSTNDGFEKVSKPFQMTFVVHSADRKSGLMIGNNATVEVGVLENDEGGIVFMELTPSGNIQLTAVADDGSAVHSRHTFIARELVPSQYYGSCQ